MSNVVKVWKGAVQPPANGWSYDDASELNDAPLSEELESWPSPLNVTVAASAETITLADGRTVALALITDDATSGDHCARYLNALDQGAIAAGLTRRNTCFVKQGTARYVVMSEYASGAVAARTSIFDFQTGAWTTEGSSFSSHTAEAVDGGYRLGFTSSVASLGYDNLRIGISSGPDLADVTYSGSGDTLYAGGWQTVYTANAADPAYVKSDADGPVRSRVEGGSGYFADNKQTVTSLVHADGADAFWLSFNNGTLDTGKFCEDDGKIIPLLLLQDDASAGSDAAVTFRSSGPITVVEGESYNISFYFSEGDLTEFHLLLAATSNQYVYGDTATETFSTNQADYGNITKISGGYRIDIGYTGQADTTLYVYIGLAEGATRNVPLDGTSNAWLGGFQMTASSEVQPFADLPDGETTVLNANAVYLYKGAVQPTQFAFNRPFLMDLTTDLVYDLVQDLER